MSLKKRRQIAAEKAEVEAQRAEIKEAFKKHKIEQEFGKISSEALFSPITKRLPEIPELSEEEKKEKKKEEDKRKKKEEEERERKRKGEEEGPDYSMDEIDRTNPFGADFVPDKETPPPSPSPQDEGPDYGIEEDDEDEDEDDEETREGGREEPTAPNLKKLEGDDLRSINSMISKSEGDENYKVKKGKYKGFTRNQLFDEGAKIYGRRNDELPQKYRDHFSARAGETEDSQEGSGFADPNALVNQLYISIQGIKAGNNSQKLRKQIEKILSMLVSQGVLIKKQAREIFGSL